MESKVLEKVKKLLALANSGNENEARLAAERASEILVRHNLSMQDVEKAESEYGSTVVRDSFWCETEEKYVCSIINAHFFVETFDRLHANERHPTSKSRRRTLTFVGTKTNIEIAEYIYKFLMTEFRMMWKTYKIESNTNERSRQSYYLGLFNGLHAQLRARRIAVETETGLVVVKDKGLSRHIEKNFGKLKKTATKVADRDASARAAGFEQGKTMQIRRGLDDGYSASRGKVIQISGGKS